VCINNGASQAMVVPFVNKKIMEKHLAQISKATPTGRHAVIIMAQVGIVTILMQAFKTFL